MTTLGVKRDYVVCEGHRVSSELHLDTRTGLAVGRTRTRSTVGWQAFQSGVQALVLGASGVVLAAGPLAAYEVGDSSVRHNERTDVWAWYVPRNVVERAVETALVHTWNLAWLRNMQFTRGDVSEINDVVNDPKMGDLAIGGEMTWPAEEMPWATWQDGRIRSGGGITEPIVLPRPLRIGGARIELRASACEP